jgi:iron complex transport system ATP-binding protein
MSCTVWPGQTSVVIGQNGAGKSTLLHAVSGSLKPASGRILWDRIPMSRLNARELAKRRAVLSQQPHIAFPIHIFKLVEMGTYASDEPLTKRKKASLVEHALREVEMEAFQDRYFYTLSGGEQKRVWLAKCIAQINCCHWADLNKYLFLDEPTAGLDLQQQQKFIELVKRFVKRRHLGVLAVLHDLNLAAQFADQILLLKEGRLLYAGSPKDVLTPPVLREVMGIESIVQPHPVYDCPHITTLSGPVSEQGLQQNTSAYERP